MGEHWAMGSRDVLHMESSNNKNHYQTQKKFHSIIINEVFRVRIPIVPSDNPPVSGYIFHGPIRG